jgi:hypothetical protein
LRRKDCNRRPGSTLSRVAQQRRLSHPGLAAQQDEASAFQGQPVDCGIQLAHDRLAAHQAGRRA